MAHGLVIVAAGEDRAMEGVIRGNVDMSLVGQDMIIELPVREVGLEGSKDVF